MIGNTIENMTGTLRKAASSILPSSQQTPFPTGTANDNGTQENIHIKPDNVCSTDRPEAQVREDGHYGKRTTWTQRSTQKLPTITGHSPQSYTNKPVPLTQDVQTTEIAAKRNNVWKTVAKRVVNFRNMRYIKESLKSKNLEERSSSPTVKQPNQKEERVYKFREISKGSDMFPSLAYDEVSDVVKCKSRRVRHVKSSPTNPMTQGHNLPSKPLPSYPPGADPIRDIRAAIRNSPFHAKETTPRRVTPRKSNIKEEWLAASPPEGEDSVPSADRDCTPGDVNRFLTPVPASTRTHSTVSSLVHFYEQEAPNTEDPEDCDKSPPNLQNPTCTVTLTAEERSATSTDITSKSVESDTNNPFTDYPVTEDCVTVREQHINKDSSDVPATQSEGLPDSLNISTSSQFVRLSGPTHISQNQTETRLSIHSDTDVTKPETRCSGSPSDQFSRIPIYLQRTSAPEGVLRSQYTRINRAMSDPYPIRMKRQLGQMGPCSTPPPDFATLRRTYSPSGKQEEDQQVNLKVEERGESPVQPLHFSSHVSTRREDNMTRSRIPIALNSTLRTFSRTPEARNTQERMVNPSVESRSSIPVPIRTMTARRNVSSENITPNDATSSPKSIVDDLLASPIPENEAAALSPPVLPQKASSPVIPPEDADDDHVYTSDGKILLRPQAVFTGEYRTKRLSRPRLDLGPTLHISRSADKLIMGENTNASNVRLSGNSREPTRRSLAEGLRASIGSHISTVNLKGVSHGEDWGPQTENGTSSTDNEDTCENSKGKARASDESPITGSSNCQKSPSKSQKRDFSGKEMSLFRRFGSKASLSSLASFRSQHPVPEDVPPVPKVPAKHIASVKGGNSSGSSSRAAIRSVQDRTAATKSVESSVAEDTHRSSAPVVASRGAIEQLDPRRRALSSNPVYLEDIPRAIEDNDSRRGPIFPPRKSSLQYLPGSSIHERPESMHVRASDSVLDPQTERPFPSRYYAGRRDVVNYSSPPRKARHTRVNHGEASTSRSSRVMGNIRSFFAKSKAQDEKRDALNKENVRLPKSSSKASIWKKKKENEKNPQKPMVTEEASTSKDFNPDNSWINLKRSKNPARGKRISSPRFFTKLPPTYIPPPPAVVPDWPSNFTPSFARPTRATEARAAASLRPPTLRNTVRTSLATARVTGSPVATATGSPLRPTQDQRILGFPAEQSGTSVIEQFSLDERFVSPGNTHTGFTPEELSNHGARPISVVAPVPVVAVPPAPAVSSVPAFPPTSTPSSHEELETSTNHTYGDVY